MILKLLSYNIRFGGRSRQRAIVEVIKQIAPDIVVFQEATDAGVIEYISRDCEMPYWGAREKHSIGFVSRLAVERHEWHHPVNAKHAFLEIQLSESEMRIFGLHLSARFSKWSERQRHFEIKALLKSIERHRHGFHVIVGDFNTLAPGEVFNLRLMPLWIRAMIWLSGRDIRRDTIQTILDAGYADGFRALHPNKKGYSFPVWQPHVRLDYIFLPAAHLSKLVSCEVVTHPHPVAAASDHFPLLANLQIEG